MKITHTQRARGAVLLALCATTGCKLHFDLDLPPAPVYSLSADELAWQGYQSGQELRFGRAGTAKIRTFRVLAVQDKTEAQASSSVIPLRGTYQTITVLGRRTDSTIYIIRSKTDSIPAVDTFLELFKYYNKTTGIVELRADIEWAKTFSHSLPLAEVITKQVIQDPMVELLPQVVLGGSTYGPTLRVTSTATATGFSRGLRLVRRVYYAQGKGVVAYEEEGTGLWYRLP